MLDIEKDARGVATVTLDRPSVRNALNVELIDGLYRAFGDLDADSDVRVVVVQGRGKVFCAGADLNYMKATAAYTIEENIEDAKRLGRMFHALRSLSKPTVARVHGAAFAGGIGLLAAADVAIAAESTVFSISEVKLGLLPSNIMPYLCSSMGVRMVRRYAVTGERFDAQVAKSTGLIHDAVPDGELDQRVARVVEELLEAGPIAVSECRALIDLVAGGVSQETRDVLSTRLAQLRAGVEAQQRLAAFFEKRG